jgi:hypothetical protein
MPFAPIAKFVHGNPIRLDHTPVANVNAGDVLTYGGGTGANAGLGSCRIAHLDIAAGSLGSLAVGYGVYDFPKSTNVGSGANLATTGASVAAYFDQVNKIVVFTTNGGSGTTTFLGLLAASCADADTTARIFHLPK